MGAEDDTALNTLIETQTENVLIAELRGYKERLEQLELENQKRGRVSEAEAMEKQKEGTQQDRQIVFYKNLSFGALLILLVVVNLLAYFYLWEHLNKFFKGLVLLIDIGLLALVISTRWKLSRSLEVVLSIIGVMGFILQIIDK
ncbi:MAG: hypothetical protein Q7K40_03190 [bacterium]|nr:hypothetical protein [bacterium]